MQCGTKGTCETRGSTALCRRVEIPSGSAGAGAGDRGEDMRNGHYK